MADQRTARADVVERRVVSRMHTYPEGNDQGPHAHRKAQLAGADRGTFNITTPAGTWVVPVAWAVWVPSFVEHEISSREYLSLYSVYLEPEDVGTLPKYPCVVSVPLLLQELVRKSTDLPTLYDEHGADGRLVATLVDQINELVALPIKVAIPTEYPLLAIYDHYRKQPNSKMTLEAWGNDLGLTRRTLSRRFVAELGIDFRSWRTQLKLLRALELLGRGVPSTYVSDELGYTSPSTFAAVFGKYLGTTPGKYFS